MDIVNLYLGYEGYPELILREKTINNQIISELRLLDFHFYEILSLIPLGQYDPDSVMYNYFSATGWYDEEWQCTRIQEFYNQLLEINDNILFKYEDVYKAVKDICHSILMNNNKLFIELV